MKRASDLKLYEDKAEKESRDGFDVTLKTAASILMDMMAITSDSEDHEEEVSDKNRAPHTASHISVVKPKNITENLPETELKTPVLRATDQRDVLNWSYAKHTQALSNNSKADAENRMQSIQLLPQSTGKHIDTHNIHHSLSTYW